MTKQIIAGVSSVALVLSLAVPAFAWFPTPKPPTVKNTAVVVNVTAANANTGKNVQAAQGMKSMNMMTTGVASTASQGIVEANNADCNCTKTANVTNTALVGNLTIANSNTGKNIQTATTQPSFFPTGSFNGMQTGAAGAQASGWVVVNSSATLTSD